MDRMTTIVAGLGMLSLGGAFSITDEPRQPRPIEIADHERALFTVLRICFPATEYSRAHCIDDHGKVFGQGVSERDCSRLAAAKIGPLKSGAKIVRGYCQEEDDRESYQVPVSP